MERNGSKNCGGRWTLRYSWVWDFLPGGCFLTLLFYSFLVVLLSHGVCSQFFLVGWTWLADCPQYTKFPCLPVGLSFLSGGGVWRLSGRSKKSIVALSNRHLCTDNNRCAFLFNVNFRLFVLFSALHIHISIWTSPGISFLGLTVFQVCSMLTLFKSSETGLFNPILPCSDTSFPSQMFKSVAWNI